MLQQLQTIMTQLDILNENPWPVLAFVVSIYATYKLVKYLIKRADYEPTEVAPRKQEPAPEPVEYFNDWAEHIAKENKKARMYKGKAGATAKTKGGKK